MTNVTEDTVIAALRHIVDTESGKDVVSLGMIGGVQVRDGHVGFVVEVPPEEGAAMEPLRKACEDAVYKVPGVLSVSAILTAHRPAGRAEAAPSAPPAAAGKPGLPGVRAIIAVASGKGGVGKSTVAVNLALGLAAEGRKVGLLDCDIYGPSVPRLMGISGRPAMTPDGKKLQPMENHGITCMSIGFLVDEETPMIWRGPMVMSALEQLMRDVVWGELDVMVCDLPPGTGDAQLTMAQRVPLTGAVIVSTPQDVALADARKGVAMFQKVEVPILGFVENMSYFLCPHCNERTDIFGHGGAAREAERLDLEFLGEIPIVTAIRETSDDGTPIVVGDPNSEPAKIFRALARRVASRIDEALGSATAPRIVIQ
jgi:ATP-binding protein involved in chromosome partitioning